MIRRPPRSTLSSSSAASDVYKRQRKTVSGLIKLLHPDGQVTKEEVEEYMRFGMEMRRRVKEQLRKIAGVEYWDVNFSYRDLETGKEQLVPCLLYTSDAADEEDSVDLGGRRII